MHLFYHPFFDVSQPELPEDESRHCVKVLRLGSGNFIYVTDGQGNWYTTKITEADAKKCRLRVIQTQADFGKRNYFIHLAVAPTKNADRTEWMVEKCVEIGVDEISFVVGERSERRTFKIDRVSKIAVSAMKQSRKAYVPVIHEPAPLSRFLGQASAAHKFIAHLDKTARRGLQKAAPLHAQYCVLIGPEGDFSPNEVRLATQHGFVPVSLGDSVLRTETAGIVACHTLNLINAVDHK